MFATKLVSHVTTISFEGCLLTLLSLDEINTIVTPGLSVENLTMDQCDFLVTKYNTILNYLLLNQNATQGDIEDEMDGICYHLTNLLKKRARYSTEKERVKEFVYCWTKYASYHCSAMCIPH